MHGIPFLLGSDSRWDRRKQQPGPGRFVCQAKEFFLKRNWWIFTRGIKQICVVEKWFYYNCVRGEMRIGREEAGRPKNRLQCYCINEVRRGYDLNAMAEEVPQRAENSWEILRMSKVHRTWLAGGNGDWFLNLTFYALLMRPVIHSRKNGNMMEMKEEE